MKKLLVLSCAYILFTQITATAAKYSCIYSTTSALSIEQCLFTDSVTAVTMCYTGKPYTWYAFASTTYASDEQGRRHRVLHADGLELDERQWLGDDGKARFTLCFSPLPKDTKVFDIIEGTLDNGFRIYGIHKAGKKLKMPELTEVTDADETSGRWLRSDTAVVRGYIEGYKRSTMPDMVEMGYTSDAIPFTDGERYPNCAKIHPDGTFTLAFRMDQPKWTYVRFSDDKEQDIFIRPTDTLDLQIRNFGQWNEEVSISNACGRPAWDKLMTNTKVNLCWQDFRALARSVSLSDYLKAADALDKEGQALLRYLSWKYHFSAWENHLIMTNWRVRMMTSRLDFQLDKASELQYIRQGQEEGHGPDVPPQLYDFAFLKAMQWQDNTVLQVPSWGDVFVKYLQENGVKLPADTWLKRIRDEAQQNSEPPFSTYRTNDGKIQTFIDSITARCHTRYIEIAFMHPVIKDKITDNYLSSLEHLASDFASSEDIAFVAVVKRVSDKTLQDRFKWRAQNKHSYYIEMDEEDFLDLRAAFRQTHVPFSVTLTHKGEIFRWPLFLNSEKSFRDVFRSLLRHERTKD